MTSLEFLRKRRSVFLHDKRKKKRKIVFCFNIQLLFNSEEFEKDCSPLLNNVYEDNDTLNALVRKLLHVTTATT